MGLVDMQYIAGKVGQGNLGHVVIRATSTLQQEKKHPLDSCF